MTKDEIIKTADGIQGWMTLTELSALYDLCQSILKKGDHAVEVGSWKGRSAFVIASVCLEKGALLTCIDTFTGSNLNEPHYKEALDMGALEFASRYIAKNLAGLPVNFIVEDSTKAHKSINNNSLAFCFIDGNHCAPVIDQDLDNYFPKVVKGGTFAGHDYKWVCPDVVKAVDRKFPDSAKIKTYDSIWVIEK